MDEQEQLRLQMEMEAEEEATKPPAHNPAAGMFGMMGSRIADPATSAAKAQGDSEAADYATTQDALRGAEKGATLSFNDNLHGVTQATIDRLFGNTKKSFGESFDAGREQSRADTAMSQKRSPTAFLTGEVGGSMLTPLPIKGGGTAGLVANAGLLSGANSLGEAKDINKEALAKAFRDMQAGGAVGLGLGAAGRGAQKLAGAGRGLVNKAQGKIDAEAAAKMQESLRSTLGMAGRKGTDASAIDKGLRDALDDPRIAEELKAAIAAKIKSGDSAFLANRRAQNWLNKYDQLLPALEEAELAHADNTAYWAEQGLDDVKKTIESRPGMWSALWRQGKPILGTLAGGAVGELLGGHGTAAGLAVGGGILGALSGKPGLVISNAARSPQFQKPLGKFLEGTGEAVTGALESPGAKLARRSPSKLQEYLDLLGQEETP